MLGPRLRMQKKSEYPPGDLGPICLLMLIANNTSV